MSEPASKQTRVWIENQFVPMIEKHSSIWREWSFGPRDVGLELKGFGLGVVQVGCFGSHTWMVTVTSRDTRKKRT